MGVDYSSYLVVGWPIEIPEEVKGNDADEYLSPLCDLVGGHFVTEGSAYSGREKYYISVAGSGEDLDVLESAIVDRLTLAKKLEKAGAKIGPFCVKAVGHIW